MKSLSQKIAILSLLVLQTLLPACSAGAKSGSPIVKKQTPQIRVEASLSQSKILQGSDGLVYLQMDIEAPRQTDSYETRKPTDFIVVLDRSGSMSAAQKMEYVHQALRTLIQQLSPQDRFGLVSFDDKAEINHYLSYVSPQDKNYLQQKISAIQPRGSTNISSGLQTAIQMVRENNSPARSERIILISDGLANQGITDPAALSSMVTAASQTRGFREASSPFALSTIGVGLDFNEYLLSNLADRGQGSYYYLQNPSGMHNILAEEFRGASEIYASNTELNFDLPPDITLTDASGYPVQRQGNHYIVQPGHIYQNQKKVIYLTLALPSTYTYSARPLGQLDLSFYVRGNFYRVPIVNSDLYVSCLPSSQRYEVSDSINQKVYEEAWTKNNYGRALKESAQKVSSGDSAGAAKVMQDYRSKVVEANAVAPSPVLSRQATEAAKAEGEVKKAFSGPNREENLKTLGKDFHYKGIQEQR